MFIHDSYVQTNEYCIMYYKREESSVDNCHNMENVLGKATSFNMSIFPISHATEKMQINYILGNATFDMKQTNLIHSIFSLNCRIPRKTQII